MDSFTSKPVSSYKFILPETRDIVFVNAVPGEPTQKQLIIGASPDQVARIHWLEEDIISVLFDDGGPSYTTTWMEFNPNNNNNQGSLATPRFLEGSLVLDHETSMKIAKLVTDYEDSSNSKSKIAAHSIKHCRYCEGEETDDEEEEEMCENCKKNIEVGQMVRMLEFGMWILRSYK